MDIRLDHASRAAAHAVNVLDRDMPKHEQFSRIVWLIQQAMIDAQAELDGIRFVPSEN
jgi:hypothetical protein